MDSLFPKGATTPQPGSLFGPTSGPTIATGSLFSFINNPANPATPGGKDSKEDSKTGDVGTPQSGTNIMQMFGSNVANSTFNNASKNEVKASASEAPAGSLGLLGASASLFTGGAALGSTQLFAPKLTSLGDQSKPTPGGLFANLTTEKKEDQTSQKSSLLTSSTSAGGLPFATSSLFGPPVLPKTVDPSPNPNTITPAPQASEKSNTLPPTLSWNTPNTTPQPLASQSLIPSESSEPTKRANTAASSSNKPTPLFGTAPAGGVGLFDPAQSLMVTPSSKALEGDQQKTLPPPPPIVSTKPQTGSSLPKKTEKIDTNSSATPLILPNNATTRITSESPNPQSSASLLSPNENLLPGSQPQRIAASPGNDDASRNLEQSTPHFKSLNESSIPQNQSSLILSPTIELQSAPSTIDNDRRLKEIFKPEDFMTEGRSDSVRATEVFLTVCNLSNEEGRLREYTLNNKKITNFIFLTLSTQPPVPIDLFERLAKQELKNWPTYSLDLRRHLFDLFDFFRDYTKIGDLKALQSIECFLNNTDYLDRIVLNNGCLNGDELRTIYEMDLSGKGVRLNPYSEELNRIMTGFLSEYANINRIAIQCIGVIERHVKKAPLGQALSKEKLYQSLFLHYFDIIDRVNTVRLRQSNPPFIEGYFIDQKFEQLMLARLLSQLAEDYKQQKLVTRAFLSRIIKKFDSYRPLDDIRPEIRILLNETAIEEVHQHILVFLLELDRVRKNPPKSSVWLESMSLEKEISETNSSCLAPFREILYGVNKLLFEKEARPSKPIGCKNALRNVRSPEWTDWMELFVLRYTSEEYTEDLEAIVAAICKVYTSDASLDKAWKRIEPNDEPTNIIKFVRRMKENEPRFRFALLSTLIGTRRSQHVRDVLGSDMFSETDWEHQVYRSMATQIGEFERSKLSESQDRQKQFAFLSDEKKEVQFKIIFFTRILELQPEEVCNIETHMFSRLSQKQPADNSMYMAIKTFMFLIDCLKFYSSELNMDYRMLTHIFRAINSVSSCGNSNITIPLFVAIGLIPSFEPSSQRPFYPYLRFIEQLPNHLNNSEAQDLIKQLKIHLDILLCEIDLMKVLPDIFQQTERENFQVMQQSYANRFSLTNKQLNDLIKKTKSRKYPESTWIRTIMEVVKVGPIDFALLTRIFKKFLIRPTHLNLECPKLLQIIANSLKDLNMVEAILTTIEVASINSRQNYCKGQQNSPFGVENHLIINTWFEGDPSKRLEARERIQDALGLLFMLLNLQKILLIGDRKQNPLSQNFVIQLLRTMKFSAAIDRYFLTKASLYSYRDQADFAESNSINIVETLFAHVNFEMIRAQNLSYNTSMKYADTNGSLNVMMWGFRASDPQDQSTKSLEYDYNNCKSRLDHCQLSNILESPLNKQCESRESVSMNAIRCINALIMLWPEAVNDKVSLIDSLLSSSVIPNIMMVIKKELLKSLTFYRVNQSEVMLVLEMLTLAAQKEFSFVELLLLPDSAGSLLSAVEDYLQDNLHDPVFFWKITALLAELFLVPNKKQKTCEQLFNKTNFCMLLVRKLEEISQKNLQPAALSKLGRDCKHPLDIFERILLERHAFKDTCLMLAVSKIVDISLELYLLRQSQSLPCLRVLTEYVITNSLYVLDTESKQEQTRSRFEVELVSMHSSLVFGMRNYLKDAQEMYFIDEVTSQGKGTFASSRMLTYMECMKQSTVAYYKKVKVMQSHSIHNMLTVVLSTGSRGYIMETLQMSFKTQACQPLLCYSHQPKLQSGFTALLGKNLENTVDNIKDLAFGILKVLNNNEKWIVDHDKMTSLLVSCLQAIKGTQVSNNGIRQLVRDMLCNLAWISQEPVMAEEIVIASFSTAQLVVSLLNLHHQLKLSSDELAPLSKVIQQTLNNSKLDPSQASVILNILLSLVDQPMNIIKILVLSLGFPDPIVFFTSSRVIAEYTRRYAVELCQAGLVDAYMKYPSLIGSNRMERLTLYTFDKERSPEQMCWVWTLEVMKCLLLYSDNKGYVVTEVLKLVQFFRTRIYTILSLPALLITKHVNNLSYAFIDELASTLSLLQVLYYQPEFWIFSHRQFFENVLYFLSHKTIDLFTPQYSMNQMFLATSNCQRKLQETTLSTKQTYEPQQINYTIGARNTAHTGTYRPNMFVFAVERKYLDCAGSFFSILANGYPHSLFVEKYFDEPIDRQLGNTYQTRFWSQLNRWIPLLQQYLEYTAHKWMSEGQFENILNLHRECEHSVEVFAGNGYLASMCPFETKSEMLEKIAYFAFWSVELAEIYLQLQLRFRNKYFSLLAEDLLSFKNTQSNSICNTVQSIRRLADKFEKKTTDRFIEVGLRFDRIRVL